MLRSTTEYSCPAAKRLYAASVITAVVGAICICVGIGLPYWHEADNFHDGVFGACRKEYRDCKTYDEDSSLKYRSAKFIPLLWGLTICGLVLLLFGLIFLCAIYPCRMLVDHCKATLAIFVAVFFFIAAVCVLAAMVIYLDRFARYDVRYKDSHGKLLDDVGYAWYITLIGVILLIINLICFALHVFFLLYYSQDTTKVTSFN